MRKKTTVAEALAGTVRSVLNFAGRAKSCAILHETLAGKPGARARLLCGIAAVAAAVLAHSCSRMPSPAGLDPETASLIDMEMVKNTNGSSVGYASYTLLNKLELRQGGGRVERKWRERRGECMKLPGKRLH